VNKDTLFRWVLRNDEKTMAFLVHLGLKGDIEWEKRVGAYTWTSGLV